ncbi:MAG: hypothetical protein M3405_01025 [Acidobacteriota bacterium]|jgi:hypothetical protein|nr:hypothetical protein [Acidobacteriota bacterium]
MMTPQEIIKQIRLLPKEQQDEVIKNVKQEISEDEVERILLARGIISEIPENWRDKDEDFEPIEIKGKPLSETIIEERR